MKRYIKTMDIPGGSAIGMFEELIRKQNENVREDIDTCGKMYAYLGQVKSTTNVFGWRVTDGEKFFCANHCFEHGCSSVIHVYRTNKKGDFDCMKPIASYPNYVDIETVLDIFFDTYVPSEDEEPFEVKEQESLLEEDEKDEAASLELK